VEDLNIFACHELVCWPVEELQTLVRLRTLEISGCDYLEGNGSSSEESLVLPHLERLYISGCDSLLEIPKLYAPLEDLTIISCKKLVALPSNLEDMAKLRDFSLIHCHVLKELPSGMDGLTSLEKLNIQWCPRLEALPQGLLQRLPAIKSLTVSGSPELAGRCREGGIISAWSPPSDV
jgi:hypothetical protein